MGLTVSSPETVGRSEELFRLICERCYRLLYSIALFCFVYLYLNIYSILFSFFLSFFFPFLLFTEQYYLSYA